MFGRRVSSICPYYCTQSYSLNQHDSTTDDERAVRRQIIGVLARFQRRARERAVRQKCFDSRGVRACVRACRCGPHNARTMYTHGTPPPPTNILPEWIWMKRVARTTILLLLCVGSEGKLFYTAFWQLNLWVLVFPSKCKHVWWYTWHIRGTILDNRRFCSVTLLGAARCSTDSELLTSNFFAQLHSSDFYVRYFVCYNCMRLFV